MSKHAEGAAGAKMYEWQTGDKAGEGSAKFKLFHLILAFILSFLLGLYSMRTTIKLE